MKKKQSEKHTQSGHPNPHQDSADHYKRHVEGNISVRGQIETNLPPDLREKQNTRDEETNARDKYRFGVEILTLIFVVLGAGLTGLYVYITHHIAKTGDEALYRQNRPWLGPSGTVYPYTPMTLWPEGKLPNMREGVPYNVDLLTPFGVGRSYISYDGFFNLRNFGTAPAIHAAYSVGMATDEKGVERASNNACDAAERAINSGRTTKESRGGITLFPNSEEPEPFVAGLVANAVPQSALLLGCIKYDDSSGRRHTTRFCQYGMSGNSRSSITCSLQTYTD